MATCFIIMPITTPEERIAQYGADPDHFLHVQDHLFIPAIQAAELDPVTPAAQGSDLIHAEIIYNLETADLVLCDITLLNANVFFELGIRTALNKPVCLVKDSLTARIPFDAALLNCHTYSNQLRPWSLARETTNLTKHIRDSRLRSDGTNTMWRRFGLTQVGQPSIEDNPLEAKIDFALAQIGRIATQLDAEPVSDPYSTIADRVIEAFGNSSVDIVKPEGSNILFVIRKNQIDMREFDMLCKLALRFGIYLILQDPQEPPAGE
jgi:hypothetical protein